jgi:hypothetical protein
MKAVPKPTIGDEASLTIVSAPVLDDQVSLSNSCAALSKLIPRSLTFRRFFAASYSIPIPIALAATS